MTVVACAIARVNHVQKATTRRMRPENMNINMRLISHEAILNKQIMIPIMSIMVKNRQAIVNSP